MSHTDDTEKPGGNQPAGEPNALRGHSDEVPTAGYLKNRHQSLYINIDDGGWAVKEDGGNTQYVVVPHVSGAYYIVVASGPWKGYFLSYDNRYYVGAYKNWDLDARYWTLDPIDCAPYPGMYIYNGYLCCNGDVDSDGLLSLEVT